MAYRYCKYNNQNSEFCEFKQDSLPNIPQLPWGHKSCQVIDISNCNKNKWKIERPMYAIVSTMSRPVPQIRNWCAPGRPMPQLSNNSNNSDFSINGGKIDPETGFYLTDTQYNGHSINHDDYLQYNNPNIKINSEGKIACADEEGTYQQNFYSGPGWKSSRVHGRTKNTALPRPIKHWRRQLFPRQYIDQDGQPLPDIPNDQLAITENIITRGRRYNAFNSFERPNGYSITKIKMFKETIEIKDEKGNIIGGRAVTCQPIWIINTKEVIDQSNCNYVNKYTPNTLPQCPQRNALISARPGTYVDLGPYQFQSNKGYLQSRAKLSYQADTFSNVPYVYNYLNIKIDNEKMKEILYEPNNFPPSTYSLYRNNQPVKTSFFISEQQTCYNPDLSSNIYTTPASKCLCKQAITYKPSNRAFQRNSAVQASSNTKRKGRNQITRKQYNITNFWGNTTPNTALYTECFGSRTTMRGTFKCTPPEIKRDFPGVYYNRNIMEII